MDCFLKSGEKTLGTVHYILFLEPLKLTKINPSSAGYLQSFPADDIESLSILI
jgi:hypothetical protein